MEIDLLVSILAGHGEQVIKYRATNTTTPPLLHDSHASYFAGWMESPGANCVTVFVFNKHMQASRIQAIPLHIARHILFPDKYLRPNGAYFIPIA
jgi:hypothetical protein